VVLVEAVVVDLELYLDAGRRGIGGVIGGGARASAAPSAEVHRSELV
jgi:hypothetical protein